MPDPVVLLVLAGIGLVLLYFASGGRDGGRRRGRDIPESELAIRPGYTAYSGLAHPTEYHPEVLQGASGRRQKRRRLKRRGERDNTLRG